MRTKKGSAVYQLTVTQADVSPVVWRRLQVQEELPLPVLWQVLERAFAWEGRQPHRFLHGGHTYGAEAAGGKRPQVTDESRVPIRYLLGRVGQNLDCVCGAGCERRLHLLLDGIFLAEAGAAYPRCIAGEGGGFSLEGIQAALQVKFKAARPPAPGLLPWPSPATGPQRQIVSRLLAELISGTPPGPPPKQQLPPGSKVVLELTDRERDLILTRSFAEEDLLRPLRVVPPRGKPLLARYTLGDLDCLGGHVAAQANHCEDRKLRKEWDAIFAKISALLDAYADGDE